MDVGRVAMPVALLAVFAAGCSAATRDTAQEPAATAPMSASAGAAIHERREDAQPEPPLAIIESLAGGLTVERDAEVEAVFKARPETADMVVRSLLRDGEFVGAVALQDFGETVNQQEITDFLAGAEESGSDQGQATRTNLRGYPAVVTFMPDRKVWAFVIDRYLGVVAGPDEGVVDDIAIQLARRLSR